MNSTLLMALKGGGRNKCGMTDLFVFHGGLYLLAAGGELWCIRRVVCCFWVDFVYDVRVWLAQLRY